MNNFRCCTGKGFYADFEACDEDAAGPLFDIEQKDVMAIAKALGLTAEDLK